MLAIRVWQDNKGKSENDSSWYLKHIIVHDMQTRQKFFFICEKWLAIDKDDCRLERTLPISLKHDKTQPKYLLSKQTRNNLSDNHLWLSIFARPTGSSFTRLDRLTCCFVLLSMSMLMNIMYYGVMDEDDGTTGFKIGPYINLTLKQISIGVITNLIVFPPSFLLVQMFRRSKQKHSRLAKIKLMLSQNMEKTTNSNAKKKSFEVKFPWWFKIIAYVLSFAFAGVSLFFVIVKGIEFGDDKVTKWLTSLIVSFLSSIILTQPLQVILLTVFFVTICRSSNDKNELDTQDDDNKVLNKWENVTLFAFLFCIKNFKK